ncbi:MAG: O-antigen ligase family protein [Cyanobacteria bacterium P01_A01_bin.114]
MSIKIRATLTNPSFTLEQLEQWSFFAVFLLFPAGIVMPPVLRKGVNLLGYLLAAFLFVRHWRKLSYVFSQDILLVIMHGLAIASIFWSAAPDITSESVRALLRTSLLGAYLATFYKPDEQRQLLGKLLLLWGGASLIASLVPGYGQMTGKYAGAWIGIYGFKYGLGSTMAIGVIIALVTFVGKCERQLAVLSGAAIAFAMIVLSVSKTSLMSLMIALSIFPLYFIAKRQFKLRVALSALAILIAVGGVALFILNIQTIVVDWLGKDLTFTGRLPLWEAIARQGAERPLLGYGHGGAFWFTEYAIEAAYENQWPHLPPTGTYFDGMHSHNGFIELFVQFGWVGLVLCIVHAVGLIIRLSALAFGQRNLEYLWMLQILVLVVFANLAEVGTFLEANNLLWMLYVAMSCSSAVQFHSQAPPDKHRTQWNKARRAD